MATKTRHLEYVKNIPRQDTSKDIYHRDFMNQLFLVLNYDHSDMFFSSLPSSDKRNLSNLYQKLKESFFALIYVSRPETQQLEDWASLKWASILTGPIGCGKTTILLRVFENLKRDQNYSAFYFDLYKLFAQLDSYDHHLITRNEGDESKYLEIVPTQIPPKLESSIDVCGVILQELERSCEKTIDSFHKLYGLFKVKNHPDYHNLKMSIQENESPISSDDWARALTNSKYKEKKIEIDNRSTRESIKGLETLLRFLKEVFPTKKTIIMLDNIDRYSIHLQQEIYNKADSLSRTELAKLILAFRVQNLRNLRREGEHGSIYHHENISIENVKVKTYRDIGLYALSASVDLVKCYVSKRLTFLRNFKPDVVQREKFGELFGKDLNIVYEQFEILLHNLLDRTTSGDAADNLVGSYSQWCNGSLRNTAIHVSKFLSALILGHETRYSAKTLLKAEKTGKVDKRLLRTYVYKKMICGDSQFFDGHQRFNAFSSLESISQVGPFYFPEMKLLFYLNSIGGSIFYNDLLKQFAICGVNRRIVFEALLKLKTARSESERGYIYIDKKESLIREDMNDDTMIVLMPSGEFFTNVLCTTCEYLFWSAMDTELSYILDEFRTHAFPNEIDYDVIQDDIFKAAIAVNYLCESIIPILKKEITAFLDGFGMTKKDSEIKEHLRHFAKHNVFLGRNMISSLMKFISEPSFEVRRKQMWASLSKAENELKKFEIYP